MLEYWLADRGGAKFASRVKGTTSLEHAPAEVGSLGDEIDLLPKVLPIVSHQDLPGRVVDVDPPRISKSLCPSLGSETLASDIGIVARDGIRFAVRRIVDVDSQYLGK